MHTVNCIADLDLAQPKRLSSAIRPLLRLILAVAAICAFTENGIAAVPQAERSALVSLYYSANGQAWSWQTNWVVDGNFNAPGTECEWFGITCDARGTTVVQILLNANNLSGTLGDLSALLNLQVLDVSYNHIQGPLPNLSQFQALRYVNIRSNRFSGTIPAFRAIPNLETILLGLNGFTGTLPALENLPALQVFDASNDNLTGQIPSLAGLPALLEFYVQSNSLSGPLPPLGSYLPLQQFDVSNNLLTGSLPAFANLPNIQFVEVDHNQLSGHLPGLDGATSLQYLSAGSNRFTGEIPNLNSLSSLNNLDVSWNQLSGSIPDLSGTKIQYLDVSFNQLSGSLPVISWTQLYKFFVQGNTLSGVLPTPPNSLSPVFNNPPATLCPNRFPAVPNSDWDNATTTTPWYAKCISATYIPIDPQRIVDTRTGASTIDGQYAAGGSLGAGQTLNFTVGGRAGIPSQQASGVVLNVTATNPLSAGYLTVWPSGHSSPATSSLNFSTGQTIPNLVIVAVGIGDQVSIRNGSLGSDVVVDVLGYYSLDSTLNFTNPGPMRLLDTRHGYATVDNQFAGIGPVGGGNQVDLPVTARANIPPSVGAVVVNVTATNPSASAGFVTVWPSDQRRPATSNLNFVQNQTTANLVISKVSSDGRISLFNSAGATDLIVDISGWFPVSSELTSLLPARILDTRHGMQTTDGTAAGSGPLGSGETLNLTVLGRGGVPMTGVGAVVLNVTVTNPTSAGNLRVWPTGSALPTTSNLNFVSGLTAPNLVVAKVGSDGQVSFYNSAGTTDVIADVMGWLASP